MTRTGTIARSIAGRLGMPGFLDALVTRLSDPELRSLLMHAMRARVAGRSVADLRRQHQRDRALAPSTVDLRSFHQVDGLALDAAGAFEAVDLSPLCPLGCNATLGGIDQNNVLSTIRGAEVIADPTTALALQCAVRRRERLARDPRDAEPVRMCTSARAVRLQPVDIPEFTPHFRLFALATAGRDRGAERFEMAALREHLDVYLQFLGALAEAGFSTDRIEVAVSDTRLTDRIARAAGIDLAPVLAAVRAHRPDDHGHVFRDAGVALPAMVEDPERELGDIADRCDVWPEVRRLARVRREVFGALQARHPGVRFGFEPARLQGLAYYTGYSFHIYIRSDAMGRPALADGGFTRWTARLLQNRKERFLASGIGTELVCKAFGPARSEPQQLG